jgi:hypothetical protein
MQYEMDPFSQLEISLCAHYDIYLAIGISFINNIHLGLDVIDICLAAQQEKVAADRQIVSRYFLARK